LKQVAVMSGKGGAGKTSFTAALVALFPELVAVDADVNASNLPILLEPVRLDDEVFYGMDIARIDPQLCSDCGQCRQACVFDAIDLDSEGRHAVNDDCEGCAACAWVCPSDAVSMVPHPAGHRYLSRIDNGFLVHADLVPGEDNSGKLIARVREHAVQQAGDHGIERILIDGPPGISCQAISTLTGVQLVLVVLEESLSGLSDYQRLAVLINQLRLPHRVVLNKALADSELGRRCRRTIALHGGELVAVIPFDPEIPAALSRRETLLDMPRYGDTVRQVHQALVDFLA
jgi:MinD superfamily P-loop ATPase